MTKKSKALAGSSNPAKAQKRNQRRKNNTGDCVASAENHPLLCAAAEHLGASPDWTDGLTNVALLLAADLTSGTIDALDATQIICDAAEARGLSRVAAASDFREAVRAVRAGRTERAGDVKPAEQESGSLPETQARPTRATQLVALARDSAELFHDTDGRHFATIEIGGHRETHAVRSAHFGRLLSALYFNLHSAVVSDSALNEALRVIEQIASEGPQIETDVRVAERGGRIYIDLCDATWRAVEISASGWSVLTEPPIRFRRAKSMLPLPEPQPGGSMSDLRELLNISDDDWILYCAWLVAALRPGFPFPILLITGEQGSAKSTAARFARQLTDPNVAPLRALPRDERDLVIAANNSWALAYDNCSHLPDWVSDALCRISTGGGFSARTLYSDEDETIFAAKRPLIINGIGDPATRSDLMDRCLVLSLPAIPSYRRMSESAINARFAEMWPRVFGALLTVVSVALRELPTTTLTELPRMADFALWATAAETGLGFAPGEFVGVYAQNRDESNAVLIEASPVAQALYDLLNFRNRWEGTATELLAELNSRQPEADRQRRSGWPQKANTLSNQLARIAPNLRATGIDVQRQHTRRGSLISVRRIESESVADAAADDLLLMPVSGLTLERRAVRL